LGCMFKQLGVYGQAIKFHKFKKLIQTTW